MFTTHNHLRSQYPNAAYRLKVEDDRECDRQKAAYAELSKERAKTAARLSASINKDPTADAGEHRPLSASQPLNLFKGENPGRFAKWDKM
mmetsp:Transcript_13945/g.29997  ORF Transcript_13945/g.29997 Transcript_13945/m.29997 type:complete len:90 (-) Transcript_13945:171-440(-)